ncbi:MAG: succinate dehydrogenase, hydrophobic membrane anchor protein [Marinobacterium sp.]|nr:succinate dehydrogenase, hydrophobic membrane anchor protein [Marinobacterium sp.]
MGMIAEFTQNGTKQWIFQRISNLAIVLYGLVFVALVAGMDTVNYDSWIALYNAAWFKLYSSLTLILVCLNSILAGWQIGADYIKEEGTNKLYNLVVRAGSAFYLVFGLVIFWAG